VIGLQWGDEAKGKLVDLLTERHEMVVRYQGGSNAGHTIVFGGQTYKLSLVPSGILSPHVQCIVTGGVVINPASILQEIDGLTSRGIQVQGRLMLSDRAHVIFPWHVAEDKAMDKSCSSGENIGTTMRGIGPCYADKVGRSHAVRLGDLYRSDIAEKITHIAEAKQSRIAAMGGDNDPPLDTKQIIADYAALAERLRPYVGDTTATLLDAMDQDKRVLFEGAQGALLDIDHGTFPFVTSSNSSGVGVCSGSGVPPRHIKRVIGVVKAYTTRVGGGPFPTEQDNEIGQQIRDRGNEYGTVTRRPRRCGWFDSVAARYTARLSGVDSIAVMLLDVLATMPELKICTAYEIDGRRVTQFPSHVDDLRRAVPVYETLPGWQQEITTARQMSDLPENARLYLQRISELVGRPVEVVSIGPDREQTILAGEWAQSLKA
jgi:adenylosuccinate synthase